MRKKEEHRNRIEKAKASISVTLAGAFYFIPILK